MLLPTGLVGAVSEPPGSFAPASDMDELPRYDWRRSLSSEPSQELRRSSNCGRLPGLVDDEGE